MFNPSRPFSSPSSSHHERMGEAIFYLLLLFSFCLSPSMGVLSLLYGSLCPLNKWSFVSLISGVSSHMVSGQKIQSLWCFSDPICFDELSWESVLNPRPDLLVRDLSNNYNFFVLLVLICISFIFVYPIDLYFSSGKFYLSDLVILTGSFLSISADCFQQS